MSSFRPNGCVFASLAVLVAIGGCSSSRDEPAGVEAVDQATPASKVTEGAAQALTAGDQPNSEQSSAAVAVKPPAPSAVEPPTEKSTTGVASSVQAPPGVESAGADDQTTPDREASPADAAPSVAAEPSATPSQENSELSPPTQTAADESANDTVPKTALSQQPQAAGKAEAQPQGEAEIGNETSLARFEELLRRKPLHRPAFEGLVKYYAERDKLASLVKQYEEKVEALPDDVALRIVLARLYLRSNQADRAVEIVESLPADSAASRSDASELLSFQSQLYQRVGRGEEAIELLRKAIVQAKTISLQTKLTESLADLQLLAGDRAAAAKVLVDFAAQHPEQFFHRKRIADALASRGLHEAAIDEYRSILKLVEKETDKRCEVLRQLGSSHEKLGQRDAAIEIYKEAIGLLAGGHWMGQELHDRVVKLYRASGRTDELIQYCRDQIKQKPEQTAMRSLLADVLVAADQADEAKAVLAEAVRLFPRDRALSETRVEVLERTKDLEGVSEEYERIIVQFPDEIEPYVSYGRFLARNQKLENARNQWKHVLAAKVATAELADRLGAMFEQYELYDDAVECYRRAIGLEPKRPESYIALSQLWFGRGDRDQAVAALDEMAAANPDDATMLARLSESLQRLSLPEKALEAVTKACTLEPEQYRYQSARADLLAQTGAVDESLSVRRQAIDLIKNPEQQIQAISILVNMHHTARKLAPLQQSESAGLTNDPHNPVRLLILAMAADLGRDFVAARTHLETLLREQPGHLEAHMQLARLLEASGEVDAAVRQYRAIIELAPARSRACYQAIAELKLRYSDHAGALETFEELAQSAPDNATVLRLVAEQLMRLEDTDKALRYFQKSVELRPDDSQGRLQYARALKETGQRENALKEFKQIALQVDDLASAGEATVLLYETAGQLGEIQTLLDELKGRVDENPDDATAAHVLALLYIHEYEYAQASQLLELVLRQRPADVNLRLVQADLSRRLLQYDAAVSEYERVLRYPNIDRDYVLAELGKALFEAGRLDDARQTWQRMNNKLYAGTLLRNNSMPAAAIEVLEDGIRLTPDAFNLHRALIQTYIASGQTEEALAASRRLADLEPDNPQNIRQLAEAYLKQGDRAHAAEAAGRLFATQMRTTQTAGGGMQSMFGMQNVSLSLLQMWSAYGYRGSQKHPLSDAIEFFSNNGLVAELETIFTRQIETQPRDVLFKLIAADEFVSRFGKPDKALTLLQELETAEIPQEFQTWLGDCSQRDYFRLRALSLILAQTALRDAQSSALSKKAAAELTNDERIVLGLIRLSTGARDEGVKLFEDAVRAGKDDPVAGNLLVGALLSDEKFEQAEPYARQLVDVLAAQSKRLRPELRERVRREFVRTLPPAMQAQVTEALLDEMAEKWSRGSVSIGGAFDEQASPLTVPNEFQTRMMLATIYAKTGRGEQAQAAWKELEPKASADVESWIALSTAAQQHEQDESAFQYYEKAMRSARELTGNALLDRIYGNSARLLYGEWDDAPIDSSFNRILASFAKREKLMELYDFLRETEGVAKARKVAGAFNLLDRLQTDFTERVKRAAENYRKSNADPLEKSLPYFLEVCKLAETLDWKGDWNGARDVYEQYLHDFPDEIELLQMLGDAAEAQGDYQRALDCEKRCVEAAMRLARRGPAWQARALRIRPSVPAILAGSYSGSSWTGRGGNPYWGGYNSSSALDASESLMRIARLYLAMDNAVAAVDAIQQAIERAGTNRERVAEQAQLIAKERQLTKELLPVFRTMMVRMPDDLNVQLAYADSLEKNERQPAAAEIYRRMLRRGVNDVALLETIKRRLASTAGEAQAPAEATLADLEADVQNKPGDVRSRLRLARAYYYSLEIDKSLELLQQVHEQAPHLDEASELLTEIFTVQGDTQNLAAVLRERIKRTTDDTERRTRTTQLANVLIESGDTEAAVEALVETVDPQQPQSYAEVGMLLQYLGRDEKALEQFELREKSSGAPQSEEEEPASAMIARVLAFRGDFDGAAARMEKTARERMRDSSAQSPIMVAWYGNEREQQNVFQPFLSLFAVFPETLDRIQARVKAGFEKEPDNLAARRLLLQLHLATGRNDLAEALMKQPAAADLNDSESLQKQIEEAVKRGEYDKAIELGEQWLAREKKTELPAGLPAQYATQMLLGSPRTQMICTIGDLHWKLGRQDKALESYRRLVDEKVDETRLAFAMICAFRGRIDEARSLVDKALKEQQVPSEGLLELHAFLAALAGDANACFPILMQICKAQDVGTPSEGMDYFGGQSGGAIPMLEVVAKELGRVDEYIAFAEARIAANPNDWQRYAQLSQFLTKIGRAEQGRAVIAKAAEVKPLRLQALQFRAAELESLGQSDELIALYEELIDLTLKQVDPTEAQRASRRVYSYDSERSDSSVDNLRLRLAKLYWQKGRHDDAIRVWKTGRNEGDPGTHDYVARMLAEQEEFARAEESYRKAIQLDPKDFFAHMALMSESFYRGDLPAAGNHMREVVLKRYRNLIHQSESDEERSQSDELTVLRQVHAGSGAKLPQPSPASGEDRDAALMLAALTGDWKYVDAVLQPLFEQTPYDPSIWALWAKSRLRAGDLPAALQALEQLQRISTTSLAARHRNLKLALAGKQVQAAGGSAGPNASAPTMSTGRRRRYYAGAGTASQWQDSEGSEISGMLVPLCLQAGAFDKAERLSLKNRSEFVSRTLPLLVSLKQRQGQNARVIELAKLVVASPVDNQAKYRVLDTLAESGEADLAVDISLNLARFGENAENDYRHGHMQRGVTSQLAIFDNPFNEERSEQSHIANLYRLLDKHGKLDAAIEKLSKRSQADPADPGPVQMIAQLYALRGDWKTARDQFQQLLQRDPNNAQLKTAIFNLNVQLRDWKSALAMADQLAKPQGNTSVEGAKWALCRAALHLLDGHPEQAASLLPAQLPAGLDDDTAFAGLLIATDQRNRVIGNLEEQRKSGQLQETQIVRLFDLYQDAGEWQKASRIASDEIWSSPQLIDENEWFERLYDLVRAAGASAEAIAAAADRPQDKALLELVRHGPADGTRAFAAALEQQPDSIDVQRGLAAAAALSGDNALAEQVNDRLLAAIKPRRLDIWRAAKESSLKQRIDGMSRGYMDSDTSTGQVLVSLSMSRMLSQLAESSQYSQNSNDVTYEALWTVHRELRGKLLLRNGKVTELLADLRDAQASTTDGSMRRSRWMANESWGYQPDYTADWREQAKGKLADCGYTQELLALLDAQGTRLGERDWPLMSELCAAVGRSEDSARWKQLWIEQSLIRLRSDDMPRLDRSREWMEVYDENGNDWTNYRGALSQSHPQDDDKAVNQSVRMGWSNRWDRYPYYRNRAYFGTWQSDGLLNRFAVEDPEVGRRLAGIADQLALGWAGSNAADTLNEYFIASKQPKIAVELLERMQPLEQTVKSAGQLQTYLRAAYHAGEYERVEKALEAVEKIHPKLEMCVALERLMLRRHQNRADDADRLESTLVAACKTIPVLPRSPDDPIAKRLASVVDASRYGYEYDDVWQRSGDDSLQNPYVQLAAAAGVRLQQSMRAEDLTLGQIRTEYTAHGLYDHALRIVDLELERLPQESGEGVRMQFIQAKAQLLSRAKRADEAKQLFEQVKEYRKRTKGAGKEEQNEYQDELTATDGDDRPDFAALLKTLLDDRKSDWRADVHRLREASYLFKLGRYNEAWPIYETAIRRGELLSGQDTEEMYRAGIAACESGQREPGLVLLRRALWRDPSDKLAVKARECVGDGAKTNQ
ncbi:MAG: tetratricopeptide repeat protein [Planctomycetaceae bacterium]